MPDGMPDGGMKDAARPKPVTVYVALLGLTILWLGLILAAPWLMADRRFAASLAIYQGLSAVCHQIPERSFYFRGFPLGVCSRCAGIYAGFAAGLLVYPLARDLREERFPPRWGLMAAAAPTVVDFTGGILGLFTNSFFSRALTGVLFGAVVSFYVTPGFVSALNDRRAGSAEPKANR
jgi:uncharacterized membrane protein